MATLSLVCQQLYRTHGMMPLLALLLLFTFGLPKLGFMYSLFTVFNQRRQSAASRVLIDFILAKTQS